MSATRTLHHWTAPLALSWVALTAFIDTFAIVPLLAPYAINELGASSVQAGLILGLYSLSSLLGNLGAGVLLDRLGRRLPMVLSLLVAGAAVGLYAVASTPQEMMALRVVHGLAGAVYVPALFALVSERAGSNRTRAIGTTSALIGLMALVGPVSSGIVASNYGMVPVFLGVAVMMVLAGIGALSLAEVYQRPQRNVRIHPQYVLSIAGVRAALGLTLAMTFAMGILTFSLPVVLESAGFDPAYRGRMFGLFALIAAGFMAAIRSKTALGGAGLRAMLGVASLILGALALNWLPVPGGTWISVVFYGIGFGLTFPAVNLLAYEHASEHLRGTALALLQASFSLGYVFGPLVAGSLPSLAGTVGAAGGLMLLIMAGWTLRSTTSTQT